MKRQVVLFGLCILLAAASITAAPVERYFKFEVNSPSELTKITKIISVDNVENGVVYAYANEQEWNEFLKLGYIVELLPRPSTLHEPAMSDSKDALGLWDTYPTYEAYVAWMYSFDTNYSDICRVFSIGQTTEGREILFAKISDNVDVEEDEPEVMYTGTIHGDETTGYVLSIRLIDSLLSAYGTDPDITRMVDSMEIWINPASNPDGTYAGGNNTVFGSTRGNANGVDLNRNYPDFQDGPHPDGNAWQIETQHFMALAEQQSFVISANFHGGAEVFNYPWDTWSTLAADDGWWQEAGRAFADTIHVYSPSSYMDGFVNGITNGYAWYEVDGGRQDYMNYYHGCREVTVELSNTKTLAGSLLPAHWDYNKRSWLQYLENALYGIRGIVTDANTSQPVAATIHVMNHDIDNSEVYTDPEVGDYHRMLEAGTYSLVFSSPGYFSDTVENISVIDYQSTRVDVQLVPLPDEPVLIFVELTKSSSQPGDAVLMDVTLQNIGGGNANNVTATLFSDDVFVTVTQPGSTYPSMQALGGIGESQAAFGFSIADSAALFHQVPFQLEVTNGAGYTDTVNFEFMVGDRVAFFTDDFSVDMGWTGYGSTAQWERGAPGGLGGDPSSDHSASSDNMVVGNDLTVDGKYNNSISGTQWLTSPVIDCSNHTGVELLFWQQLGCEDSQYDHCYFEVYNGTSWVTLYSNPGSSFQETSWSEKFYDVSAHADNNPNFRIRFGMGSTDGSVNYSGWNIDDIELKGYGEAGTAIMAFAPSEIVDTLETGQQGQHTIKVDNTGDGTLSVDFSTTDSWIQIVTQKASVPPGDSMTVMVTVDADGLADGQYDGSIEYISNDATNASGSIPVTLIVGSPGCCQGASVGNVDGDPSNDVTLGDLTVLIDMLFVSLTPVDCLQEADVDLSGAPDPSITDVNLGDLTVLVDNLFISLAPLPPCP